MNAPTRTLAATAALGLGLAGTATAHAKPKPPDPKTTGCSYEGGTYSHGAVREQTFNNSNGTKRTLYFECVNGRWYYREFPRPKGPVGDDETRRPGAPPRG